MSWRGSTLQDYPTAEAYIADGRHPFRELEGSIDIHSSLVYPDRTTLAEAIVEALAQLVKREKRKESSRPKPKGKFSHSIFRSLSLKNEAARPTLLT